MNKNKPQNKKGRDLRPLKPKNPDITGAPDNNDPNARYEDKDQS